MLSACGGGGGSSDNNTSNNNAVSDAPTPTETPILTGFFYDSAVAGLDYVACDVSLTKCLSGITDGDGKYLYQQGYTVQFKLGGLVVAESLAQPLLTPSLVSKTAADAIKLAQFLQTIDEDRDPTNGITISEQTRTLAKNTYVVEKTVKLADTTIEQAVSNVAPSGTNIVAASAAAAHAQGSEKLYYLSQSGSRYAQAILGQLSYNKASKFNVDKLLESAQARLSLEAWQSYRNFTLVPLLDELNNVDEVQKNRNRATAVVDIVKGITDIGVLAIDKGKLPNTSITAENGLYVARLVVLAGGSVAQIPKAIEGEGLVPDWATDGAKALASVADDTKSVPTLLRALVAAGGDGFKAQIDTTEMNNEDKEVTKAMTDASFIAANALIEGIKGGLTPKDLVATGAEKLAKTVIDFTAAYSLASNTKIRQSIMAAMDYLDAYYMSAGDKDWMLDKFGIHVERRLAYQDLDKKYDLGFLSPGIAQSGEYGFETIVNSAFFHVVGEEKLYSRFLGATNNRTVVEVTTKEPIRNVCVGATVGFNGSVSNAKAQVENVLWSYNTNNISVLATGLAATATFNKSGFYTMTATVDAKVDGKTITTTGVGDYVTVLPCGGVTNMSPAPTGGSVSVKQTLKGTEVGFTYTATANDYYAFDAWYDEQNNFVSASPEQSFFPSGSKNKLIARFMPTLLNPTIIDGVSYSLPSDVTDATMSQFMRDALTQVSRKVFALSGSDEDRKVGFQLMLSEGLLSYIQQSSNQVDAFMQQYFGSNLTSTSQLPILLVTMRENCKSGSCLSSSNPITPTSGKLNDTGIVFGGNYPNGNNATCTGETIASQDCSHGRDATNNDPSDGHGGFSFTKLSKTGVSLPASATDWACIKDNVTGLVWENKTTDGGIHDTNKTYRWGGVGAQIAAGQTFGTRYNDWDVLVNGSNSEQLCGFSDWRMPSRGELHSIVNYNTSAPTIDTNYFANTQSTYYWSSSPSAGSNSSGAWSVYFVNGSGFYVNIGDPLNARLVRGGQ